MSNNQFPVIGFDPSMKNWGIAEAYMSIDGSIELINVSVIQPELPEGKQVRKNSQDMERANQLFRAAYNAAKGAKAVFVEAPVGSQSAASMKSYGICMGVLGALQVMGIPIFEVTASEVKLAGHGTKTASKAEMIEWATKKHPEANWPTYKEHGQIIVNASKAEHMADAVAAIYAGYASKSFQQLLPFIRQVA